MSTDLCAVSEELERGVVRGHVEHSVAYESLDLVDVAVLAVALD